LEINKGGESYIQLSFETKKAISDHGQLPNVFLKDRELHSTVLVLLQKLQDSHQEPVLATRLLHFLFEGHPFSFVLLLIPLESISKQGKIVAKLLPTEARLRDGRPKFRNAKKVLKAKQSSGKKAKHAKKQNNRPKKPRKEKKRSYTGLLLTAS